ncbi:DUF5686 family protein [Brumimicrobium aurantiacum]|uniref:Carboxypeptidase-like regulatory domain-containing protein n=1 Tax=Brumimicrobium aurantiacum TaxID=1737063 RepID=A0A3E1EX37_9FLAO|nr:DUF5686 family protein [Brumimicrobium aurantiacum]RFC54092.1 hypothetical protein DXU93_08875 [Brumimicrobium aurantiacum]
MKNTLLLFVLFCLSNSFYAQKTQVQVLDAHSKTPVAFTKIIEDRSKTFVTDIDGKQSIEIKASSVYIFRFFEYSDTIVKGADLIDNPIVFLSPDAQVYDEVVIKPGENPAHRIIQNVMDKKKDNDPMRNDAFTYNSYSKLYVTGELEEGILRDTITDTSTIDALEFLDKQYIFLTETKAERTFSPPNYDKEVIKSYNVSGVKDPMFATLVNQFQSFSFYANDFELNQDSYINPIAPGGLRRYLFILEDTVVHQDQDTTYTIKFRPRKGKNFDGLEGYLYVRSSSWAIERVIAEPHEASGIVNVKIIQEYKMTANKKWFPSKISTILGFSGIEIEGAVELIGRSSVYINDVEFREPDFKLFSPVSVEVEEGALRDSLSLHEVRGNTASGKEGETYKVIDSVASEANLDKLVFFGKVVTTGKIPAGIFNIPVWQVAYFNRYEGLRLGLGLETNYRLSKVFGAAGYFAYGTNDKEWKGGGSVNFTLNQKRNIKLKFLYKDDVHERGNTDYYSNSFNLTEQGIYRDFFVSLMDRERVAGVNLSGLVRQNLKVQVFANYKRFKISDGYYYAPLFSQNGTQSQFDIAEAGVVINWNIRERIMMLENRRVSLGTKWPKLTLKAVKGQSGIFDANYDYYRLNFMVHQDFTIRGAGKIQLVSKCGLTYGNVPLMLQQFVEGTGINYTLSVSNTFETMGPTEFYTDKYSALFARYSFLPIKNKSSWSEPVFVIHNAAGYGEMSNRTDHKGFDFKTPDKGYFETGVIADYVIKLGPLGFGLGTFYRYGKHAFAETKDNFFYKVSVRLNFL